MKSLFLGKHWRMRSPLGGRFTLCRSLGALCQQGGSIKRSRLKCKELVRRRLDRCKGGTVFKCFFARITTRRGQLTKGDRRQNQYDDENATARSNCHRKIERP